MDSRRHVDYSSQSTMPGRSRDTGIDLALASDVYLMPHRERSPRSGRSISPSWRGERLPRRSRGTSIERREIYGRVAERVGRVRSRSRSPYYDGKHKRGTYDEGFSSRDVDLRRKYEFVEHLGNDVDVDGSVARHEYLYGHSAPRDKDIGREQVLDERRHGSLSDKLVVLETGTESRPYRLRADVPQTSRHGDGGQTFPSSEPGRFNHEGVRYPNPYQLDRLSAMEKYKTIETTATRLRDVPPNMEIAYPPKDFSGSSQYKDLPGASSGNPRGDFSGYYHEDMPSSMDAYPRRSMELTESYTLREYDYRDMIDGGRDAEASYKEARSYRRDTFSPSGPEGQDYIYPRPEIRDRDDYAYPSEVLYRRMGTGEQPNYDERVILRPSDMDPVRENLVSTEYSRRDMTINSMWNHSLRYDSHHLSVERSSGSRKPDEYLLDSGSANVKFGRKALRDLDIPPSAVSQDDELSQVRSDYGFRREVGPVSRRERVGKSSEYQYEMEAHERAVRNRGVDSDDLDIYDPLRRPRKRRYDMDEEIDRHHSRTIIPKKWMKFAREDDQCDLDEDWNDKNLRDFARMEDDHFQHRRVRTSGGADRGRASAYEELLLSDIPEGHVSEHYIKSYKHGCKKLKGQAIYNSYGNTKTHKPSRNVWIRGQDEEELDRHANGVKESEGRPGLNSADSEPLESSDEFDKLVQTFFLSFAKKLNESPATRRRYLELGKAGSLYCIVCGRSQSKDFLDTQRLVTHCYMSRKFGMRAQHLGLHRAICVLMGWSTVVAPDVITYYPESLSRSEALARQEDLILWPPIIIVRDNPLADNGQRGRKVLTVESLEDFLRGNRFRCGKVKECPGNSASNSTFLVKFLGTFSGLQDAEKLHKYFADNKHGRTEFDKLITSRGKSSSSSEGKTRGDKKELIMYGYMGIAEDLDDVDFDTKRKCSIKSKKEIKDFEDAPVKT